MLDNLKKLRKETGISQRILAEAIGVSQQSINKYENHDIEPDISTLVRLADYFNTSIDYLVGYTDIEHKIEPVTFCEVNDDENKLLKEYRKLNRKQQRIIQLIIDSYHE